MGRDTTASKRMAAKRSREKADGLRRLNVALTPEVFNKLAMLMKQHDCASQARLIELLVMDKSIILPSPKARKKRNEVTNDEIKTKRKAPSKKQQPKTEKNSSPAKAPRGKAKVTTAQKELSPAQMSLFES
ncbi:MAG TPA: hypothetical protein VN642_05550 [Dongiaceae bacterium]|nr:hypothetical protein [Dongiaceae bacterium]